MMFGVSHLEIGSWPSRLCFIRQDRRGHLISARFCFMEILPHPTKHCFSACGKRTYNQRPCDSRQRLQQLQQLRCWSYHVAIDGVAIRQDLWCLSPVGRGVSRPMIFFEIRYDDQLELYMLVVSNSTASTMRQFGTHSRFNF